MQMNLPTAEIMGFRLLSSTMSEGKKDSNPLLTNQNINKHLQFEHNLVF